MTNLSWLYSAIDGRGKSSPDATVFYGTMGSCADELKAVIVAAAAISKPCHRGEVDPDEMDTLREALAALAKKGPKT